MVLDEFKTSRDKVRRRLGVGLLRRRLSGRAFLDRCQIYNRRELLDGPVDVMAHVQHGLIAIAVGIERRVDVTVSRLCIGDRDKVGFTDAS